MAISTASQTIVVTETTGASYTPVEQDGATGEYVREVRVFAQGNEGPNTLVFRLQLRSATREGIEMATPSLVI